MRDSYGIYLQRKPLSRCQASVDTSRRLRGLGCKTILLIARTHDTSKVRLCSWGDAELPARIETVNSGFIKPCDDLLPKLSGEVASVL